MQVENQIAGNKFKTYLIIFFFITFISFFFFFIGKYSGDDRSFFLIGFILSLFSGFGSYFYSDKIVLFISGAKPAGEKKYPDFYNVVSKLSKSAGLPNPKLYVISDPSPNAFATGRDPAHAVVAATTGLFEKLDRSELEGVLAHEMSHIKNYDILVMTIVSVLVGLVVYAADFTMRGFLWGSRNDRDKRGNALGLILFILALILMPIVATLIQLAVSRRREFLADASGSLLTKNPDSLADALLKISGDRHLLQHASNATAHLYIANPFQKDKKFVNFLAGLFSTHPPIGERVRLLREM